ncbi:ARHGEF12 [Cordylochernes scorpioides]|uniref:ARHGEF12 n=1 Tax=Cordylochernes scorpioides TaxID=51811 RepID=A0ABY6KTY2_9ARAC|nr:ARHGEF12 [Cordylochernes scorpioides]
MPHPLHFSKLCPLLVHAPPIALLQAPPLTCSCPAHCTSPSSAPYLYMPIANCGCGQDVEAHPLCRRLHLSDLLPAQFQRLVKYPLLLDSLSQYSPPGSQEQEKVARAADRAKAVLAFVDRAVGEATDYLKLVDLQRRLDRAAAAETDPCVQAFYAVSCFSVASIVAQELDLKQHRLIYEGPLTWRTTRQRSVELRAVLLADRLVLLHKLDDQRLALLTLPLSPNQPSRSPVLPVSEVFTRSVATGRWCATQSL